MHEDTSSPALWYYVDAARERHGPLPASTLLERLHDGRLQRETLVWREGLAEWRPLHALAAELGLPDAPTPPPLPPPLHAAHPAGPAAAAAPRSGLSGCAIMAIIGAVGGVMLVAFLGIAAAIALPAYQDYLARAKVAQALGTLAPLKDQVAAFAAQEHRCAVNGDTGFGTPQSYAGDAIAQVRVGRFDNGHCGLEATLRLPDQKRLDGKALWLDYDERTSAWNCSSDLDDRVLPVHCRGG
ncbi:pilin [Xanthomonas sp. CFBP 8445]|uniref:pilin n=1 Tax=Xanthomonas sp. CFBP 8445 TaxID=2971236 RepID=UPI0021DF8691|nr:pilin [Xanthomonas sp. CFBP 8445]UYC12816.1 GYF domain-containing protein [Xanthomonas sp. CFBP 8445]